MSHEIETHTTETGETIAAALFARTDAWHKLGTTLPDAFTAEDAMTIGHLGGWNVRKTPLSTTILREDGVDVVEIPDRFATVRTNPWTGGVDYLGVVGAQYTPIQNEEHCQLLDALVDESGSKFDTAGSLRGGRHVFITMKLPTHMAIGGVDDLDLYIAALNAHDGTASFRLVVTPVRVVCANTQAAALGNNRGIYAIRHTVNARDSITEARRSLDLTFNYLEDFQAEAEKMIQTTMTNAEFERLIRTEFAATGESKRAQTAADQLTDTLMSLFAEADTNAPIRNTRWGGYQAITEWADHFTSPRSTDGIPVDVARAERVLMGAGLNDKRRAFDLLRVS